MAEQERGNGKQTCSATEFVTVNELATLMDVPVVKVIDACELWTYGFHQSEARCRSHGLVAEEFGYKLICHSRIAGCGEEEDTDLGKPPL